VYKRQTITSVNSFGIFVELDTFFVDGLVHITALDNDFYHFDPIGHRLHGERTGTVYRLGDRLRVQVAAVNLDDRKIDFVLAEPSGSQTDGSSRRKSAGRAKDKPAAPSGSKAPSGSTAPSGSKKPRQRNRRKRKPSGQASSD